MEDLIADTKLRVEEIQSTMFILQESIRYDYSDLTKKDVDNCLTVMMSKTEEIINILTEYEENFVAPIPQQQELQEESQES